MTATRRLPRLAPKRAEQGASAAPGELTIARGGLLRSPFHSSSCAQSSSFPISDHTPKPDMASGCVDRLGVPRGGTVTAAVVRRAQMRAALDDLAGNLDVRLAGIVTRCLRAAARVFRDAAGFGRIGLVLLRVPVRGPFPA